jgi:hypothetical protein
LDPNLVKALIATESGFQPTTLAKKSDPKSARGLMQLTDQARKILADPDGELKDHFVTTTREELNDPNMNICAGIRWLFQKQKLASAKLGEDADWTQTIFIYKGLKTASKERAQES